MSKYIEPVVIVHGGAGDIPDSRNQGKHTGAIRAVRIGYNKLLETNSVLDAVEAAVKDLENDENFNAGYGAILNWDGNVELEASIMEGKNLNAGCVSLLKDIRHPISVARRVMDSTVHTFLGGDGAMKFAREQNFEILEPPGQLVTQHAINALENFKKDVESGSVLAGRTEIGDQKTYGEPGTVGAVAIDAEGNIAVATSTGGITGKLAGRIGDTPLLGSGTYADNRYGGVSTTGHGETIMRYSVAHDILMRINHCGISAQSATEKSLQDMTDKLQNTAGAITIDAKGDVGIYFTSLKMSWAYKRGKSIHYGITKGEDIELLE